MTVPRSMRKERRTVNEDDGNAEVFDFFHVANYLQYLEEAYVASYLR